MEEKLGIIEQGMIAMFQAKDYNKLRAQKTSRMVRYFFILLFLVVVIQYVIPIAAWIAAKGGISGIILKEVPTFHYENGKLTMEEKLERDVPEFGVYILVDTEKEAFSEDDLRANYIQEFLISQTNIVIKQGTIVSNKKLAEYMEPTIQKINNEEMIHHIYIFYIALFFAFLFIFGFTIAGYCITALLFSWTTSMLSKVMMLDISFGQIYKMALYAQSIGILVMAVANCLRSPIMVMAATIFYMIVTVGILNRALLQEKMKGES